MLAGEPVGQGGHRRVLDAQAGQVGHGQLIVGGAAGQPPRRHGGQLAMHRAHVEYPGRQRVAQLARVRGALDAVGHVLVGRGQDLRVKFLLVRHVGADRGHVRAAGQPAGLDERPGAAGRGDDHLGALDGLAGGGGEGNRHAGRGHVPLVLLSGRAAAAPDRDPLDGAHLEQCLQLVAGLPAGADHRRRACAGPGQQVRGDGPGRGRPQLGEQPAIGDQQPQRARRRVVDHRHPAADRQPPLGVAVEPGRGLDREHRRAGQVRPLHVHIPVGLGQVHPERGRHDRAAPVGHGQCLAHRGDRLRHRDQPLDVIAVKDPDHEASCLEAWPAVH